MDDEIKSPLWAVAALVVATVIGAVWVISWAYWSLLTWLGF